MVQDNFGVVADLNARALHIAELSGKSNRQLGKYPARSAARRTASPCVHVRAPYYPSLFLPSFIASRAAGNNPLPPNALDRNIVIGAANFIFSPLRIQAVTANISADQLSQTPRARTGIRPAMYDGRYVLRATIDIARESWT